VPALAEELKRMADWLALSGVDVKGRGGLAAALGRAI